MLMASAYIKNKIRWLVLEVWISINGRAKELPNPRSGTPLEGRTETSRNKAGLLLAE